MESRTLDGESDVSFESAVHEALHSKEAEQLLDTSQPYTFVIAHWEVDVHAHSPWHITTYRVKLQDAGSH